MRERLYGKAREEKGIWLIKNIIRIYEAQDLIVFGERMIIYDKIRGLPIEYLENKCIELLQTFDSKKPPRPGSREFDMIVI